MQPRIAKLGHVALVTPDLDESAWFFRDVIGLKEVERSENTVFLRALRDQEHHTLSLREGGEAALDHVGWRTWEPEHVDAFRERLEADGFDITEVDAGEEPGQGRAIRFRSPPGHRFELYFDTEKPPAPANERSTLKSRVYSLAEAGAAIPRRIDHVNVHGPNVPETHDWLRETLGFRLYEYVLDEVGSVRGGWLSTNSLAHTIAYSREKSGDVPTFHHVAFYLDSLGDLMNAADVAREHGIDVEGGPGKHGITQANFLYLRDPGSGLRLELFNGGYQVFDPDWEPIEWTAPEAEEALTWFGLAPNQETVPIE